MPESADRLPGQTEFTLQQMENTAYSFAHRMAGRLVYGILDASTKAAIYAVQFPAATGRYGLSVYVENYSEFPSGGGGGGGVNPVSAYVHDAAGNTISSTSGRLHAQAFQGTDPWSVSQSGVWSVNAAQSGAWSVNAAQSGSWAVNAAQSGAWSVAATQSGGWTVTAQQPSAWGVFLTNAGASLQVTVGNPTTDGIAASALVGHFAFGGQYGLSHSASTYSRLRSLDVKTASTVADSSLHGLIGASMLYGWDSVGSKFWRLNLSHSEAQSILADGTVHGLLGASLLYGRTGTAAAATWEALRSTGQMLYGAMADGAANPIGSELHGTTGGYASGDRGAYVKVLTRWRNQNSTGSALSALVKTYGTGGGQGVTAASDWIDFRPYNHARIYYGLKGTGAFDHLFIRMQARPAGVTAAAELFQVNEGWLPRLEHEDLQIDGTAIYRTLPVPAGNIEEARFFISGAGMGSTTKIFEVLAFHLSLKEA